MKTKDLALILAALILALAALYLFEANSAEKSENTPEKGTPAQAVSDMMEAIKGKKYEKAISHMQIDKDEKEAILQILRIASKNQYFNYRIIRTKEETARTAAVEVGLKIGNRKGKQVLPLKKIDDEWKVIISRDQLLGAGENDFRWENPAVARKRRVLTIDISEKKLVFTTKKIDEDWPLEHPETGERTLYKAYVCFEEKCKTLFPARPGVMIQRCPTCGSQMTGAGERKHDKFKLALPDVFDEK